MSIILHPEEVAGVSRACFVMDKASQDSPCGKQCMAHCSQQQHRCGYLVVDSQESSVMYTHDMFKAIWDTLSCSQMNTLASKLDCQLNDNQCAYDSIILVWNERFKVIQPHIFHEIQNVFHLSIKKLFPTSSLPVFEVEKSGKVDVVTKPSR